MRGTWDDLNRRLTSAVLALDLDDALEIRDQREEPKRGFFGSKGKASTTPRRFVKITAGQRVLLAECVGSTSFGGAWEMTPETEATLERQGWVRPWSPEYPTYQREASLFAANKLALATVRALQALGCEMAELEVELIHEEP